MFRRSLESPDENITQEYRLRHKDGTYRSIEAVCKNLLHNPYIGGFVVNYRDVTNQKLLERQREEFIGIASHELKTPVTSIKGYTQIIREYLVSEDDTEMGLYIERLNKQVDRLSHLITNLLDVTKITGGHLQLQNTVFDMNGLVGQITDEMQGMTSMNIVTDLKAQRQTWGDKERIGQVLTNLVSNAIKYSANSKDIIVRTWSDEQNITVSVKDLGIGITEKEREIIFERFFRVRDKETNTIPGIGLGLYISAQIVKRHSGDIWVNSKKGEGSEFCFTIPLNNQ
jgi:signal transduction histidine kinase